MIWIGEKVWGQILRMFNCILFCSFCYVAFIVRNKQFGICDLRSSAMLRNVDWLCTDVSGQPIGPIFKGQAVQAILFGMLGP
jgi:hypothetical protein